MVGSTEIPRNHHGTLGPVWPGDSDDSQQIFLKFEMKMNEKSCLTAFPKKNKRGLTGYPSFPSFFFAQNFMPAAFGCFQLRCSFAASVSQSDPPPQWTTTAAHVFPICCTIFRRWPAHHQVSFCSFWVGNCCAFSQPGRQRPFSREIYLFWTQPAPKTLLKRSLLDTPTTSLKNLLSECLSACLSSRLSVFFVDLFFYRCICLHPHPTPVASVTFGSFCIFAFFSYIDFFIAFFFICLHFPFLSSPPPPRSVGGVSVSSTMATTLRRSTPSRSMCGRRRWAP